MGGGGMDMGMGGPGAGGSVTRKPVNVSTVWDALKQALGDGTGTPKPPPKTPEPKEKKYKSLIK